MCVACRRRKARDWGLCTVCIWRFAREASDVYDRERKRGQRPNTAYERTIARLGPPQTY